MAQIPQVTFKNGCVKPIQCYILNGSFVKAQSRASFPKLTLRATGKKKYAWPQNTHPGSSMSSAGDPEMVLQPVQNEHSVNGFKCDT